MIGPVETSSSRPLSIPGAPRPLVPQARAGARGRPARPVGRPRVRCGIPSTLRAVNVWRMGNS